MAAKKVLVHLGERARPVEFSGGQSELMLAVRTCFRDILRQDQQVVLQVWLWSNMYKCNTILYAVAIGLAAQRFRSLGLPTGSTVINPDWGYSDKFNIKLPDQ